MDTNETNPQHPQSEVSSIAPNTTVVAPRPIGTDGKARAPKSSTESRQGAQNGTESVSPKRQSVMKQRMVHAVSHAPRQSILDRLNTRTNTDPFRGFYTLFWIVIALLVLNAFYISFERTGEVLSMTFAALISRDAWMLMLSDAIMVLSLFLCVPFVKLLYTLRLHYWPTFAIFQYVWELGLLGCVIVWARYRDWPWVQSGYFVLHTLAMIMKIHSYLTVNGTLSDLYLQLRDTEAELLDQVIASSPDPDKEAAWQHALKEADIFGDEGQHEARLVGRGADPAQVARWASLELQTDGSGERVWLHSTFQYQQLPRAQSPALSRRRLVEAVGAGHPERVDPFEPEDGPLRDPHPLHYHKDPTIAHTASLIGLLREQLYALPGQGTGMGPMWPANVTYFNFWEYLLFPVLVYQLQYPRTDRVRLEYVLERTLATFGTFFVIYVITVSWIMPLGPTEMAPDKPMYAVFLQLSVPMMLNYLLIFFIMFECVCNGFAELSRFADREFYEDWWNSASMSEFSRKWNKPVHHFLLQHVYVSSICTLGLSKKTAMFLTFLFSSVFHELVMIIVSGKVRGYLFVLQMFQIPMIIIAKVRRLPRSPPAHQQLPFIKNDRTLGNFFFWIGLMIGFPLLNIAYLVY